MAELHEERVMSPLFFIYVMLFCSVGRKTAESDTKIQLTLLIFLKKKVFF